MNDPNDTPSSTIPAPEGVGPFVINRHHYLPTPGVGPGDKTRTGRERRPELPTPYLYVGRGTALGNPFPRHLYPGVNERGELIALVKYRAWLYDRIVERHAGVLELMQRITADTHLVCSCARPLGSTEPAKPCHAYVIAAAWRWMRREHRI